MISKELVIIIGFILFIGGGVIWMGIDANQVKEQVEEKCNATDMQLWDYEYYSNNNIVVNCFKEGTDEIKRFKMEKK